MDETEIVKKIVETTALEAYKDSAKPALRVVGKSLGQCVSLFMTPLGRTAQILEKNIHRYLDKLEGLTENALVAPDARVLVPVLEKMRYIEDETVANYYAEILAAASKKETKEKVLISFIEILNRVTSDEIKILEFINSPRNIASVDGATITEQEREQYSLPNGLVNILLGTALPIIDVRITEEKQPGYRLLLNNFNLLPELVPLDFPENIDTYLDNLLSLGLLHIPYGVGFAVKPVYKHLKENQKVKKAEKDLDAKQKITFHESRIELTNLSLKLFALCGNKKEASPALLLKQAKSDPNPATWA